MNGVDDNTLPILQNGLDIATSSHRATPRPISSSHGSHDPVIRSKHSSDDEPRSDKKPINTKLKITTPMLLT